MRAYACVSVRLHVCYAEVLQMEQPKMQPSYKHCNMPEILQVLLNLLTPYASPVQPFKPIRKPCLTLQNHTQVLLNPSNLYASPV
jgi:hypothetical protein